ncbi:MAG: leucyl/phenylalanyl-tRNA--protein transferase [Leptospiraceae bacterium]|nr:leucyl/phenylalanyl-tRNA--protein transferase [Leptospiraceae bacterium]
MLDLQFDQTHLGEAMVFVLGPTAEDPFPPVELAERQPDGLLAAGGDLEVARLLNAYQSGIFPWFGPGDPILWWSPDPRMILLPAELHISRSMRKFMRTRNLEFKLDSAFEQVIHACAAPREQQSGTWIGPEMIAAYVRLHQQDWAHSAELWQSGELLGGLYGVAIDRFFFGESMFSRRTNASKAAFIGLVAFLQASGFACIDCQLHTDHLESLGARLVERSVFMDLMCRYCRDRRHKVDWQNYSSRLPGSY